MFLKSKDIIFSVIGALLLLFLASSLYSNPNTITKKARKKRKIKRRRISN